MNADADPYRTPTAHVEGDGRESRWRWLVPPMVVIALVPAFAVMVIVASEKFDPNGMLRVFLAPKALVLVFSATAAGLLLVARRWQAALGFLVYAVVIGMMNASLLQNDAAHFTALVATPVAFAGLCLFLRRKGVLR